jgi:molybdopterin molybdotransferase
MTSITVAEADNILLANTGNFGTEDVSFLDATGHVLVNDILADRDFPPYHRVTMDGIAISYQAYEVGINTFRIIATMAAGDTPPSVLTQDQCIEVMTGCALPPGLDTVVRYEDLTIKDGYAIVNDIQVKPGANIHKKGSDKLINEVVIPAGTVVDATAISIAASVGQTTLCVKKLPTVVVISTGDELVEAHMQPSLYQIRRTNSYAIKATLQQWGIQANLLHINDDADDLETQMQLCISAYDVIILSGGVSMGKFDFVPQALTNVGISRLFHKVQQRPGKPFWFGENVENNVFVFAFPGNPVSAFLCLHRYLLHWLSASLGKCYHTHLYAALSQDVTFSPQLQYFLQVNVQVNESGQLIATPVAGNGSGDFANLVASNAFMELPAHIADFRKGEVYKIIPFKTIVANG